MRARSPAAPVLLAGLFIAGCASALLGSRTPTRSPHPELVLIGDAPMVQADAQLDYEFALPAAALLEDDILHAWIVGFGGSRGDQQVIHLTSTPDGNDWEAENGRFEEALGIELSPPGPIPATVLPAQDDGQWLMYFSGVPSPAVSGAEIWRATAPGPDGPWIGEAEPVLTRADVLTDGSHAAQLDFPAVVRTEDGYLMLFGWSPTDATTVIGLATSADGIRWTVADQPAIGPDLCAGLEARSVAMPRLITLPAGGWLAIFSAFGEEADANTVVGAAYSPDGTSWTCASSDPILEVTDIPDSVRIHSYAVAAWEEGIPRMLIESLGDDGSELWLAELRTE